MYCRQCGAENPPGSLTCLSCGASLATNPYQATAPGAALADGKPKNYLVESILVTLCCCLPLGIVGIVFAAQVDSKWNGGDRAGAITAAANAKKFTIIAFALGLILNLIVFGIQIVGVLGAFANAPNAANGF